MPSELRTLVLLDHSVGPSDWKECHDSKNFLGSTVCGIIFAKEQNVIGGRQIFIIMKKED